MSSTRAFVFCTEFAARIGISAQSLPKWVAKGWAPPPDGVFGRRSAWYESTVKKYLASPLRRAAPPPGVGRSVGIEHGNSRWPKEFVAEVKRRHAKGETLGKIGIALGMSKSAVAHIVAGRRRKHG